MAKTMKVKVSNVMAKAIEKSLTERGIKFEEVSIMSLPERAYEFNVKSMYDDIYDDNVWCDRDPKTGEFKFIQVVYPYDYYAPPCYLTTARLLRLLKECHEKTIECFMDKVCDVINI